jgi:Aromatic-ring-opening dioxygenase LigAB, LigA subunit
MSAYDVNKVCWLSLHDPSFRNALRRDPQAALATALLNDEERALLLAGEVGKLHDLGAHSFLLSHLSRFELFGLDVDTYSERIRASTRQLG